jgi:hypothetical protein
MKTDDEMSACIQQMEQAPAFRQQLQELQEGLSLYWQTAGRILKTCGVTLAAPTEAFFSFRKNFFSLLFMYSYMHAGIPRPRRILYGAILQCLRGMVTGCDNLLDDEYKPILETDIPVSGHRFRSVVDIMVSDRVLFQILLKASLQQEISESQVLAASTASMKTMTRSGIEEAGEEAGISDILEPEAVLQTIHHFKTGLLFQCPWDVPLTIEAVAEKKLNPLLEGLYNIGLGCQIMDDMVDMAADIKARKHNYAVSLVHHGASQIEKEQLTKAMTSAHRDHQGTGLISCFPVAARQSLQKSHRFLTKGLSALFAEKDQVLVPSAIRFLGKRIGVYPLVNGMIE